MLDEPTATTLVEELDKFAIHIVNEMQKAEVPFAQKIDAFKALTAYHSASSKKKTTGPGEGDDDDLPSRPDFSALKRTIRVVAEDEHGTVEAANR